MTAFRTLVRGLAGAALFLSGCGVVESCASRQCEQGTGCADRGECSVRFTKTGDGPWRCYAGSDDDCADSEGCKSDGKCFATEVGTCVAEDEVEANRCENAKVCAFRGDCKPSGEGFCVASDEAACRASEICTRDGQCGYIGESALGGMARCGVTDEADCEKSTGCAERGDCGVWDGSAKFCAATSKAHCEQSTICSEEGACDFIEGRTLRQGRCVFIPSSDDDCAQSPVCRLHGGCSMVPGDAPSDPPQCSPTEVAHCEASEGCKKDRKCKYWPRATPKNEARGGSCGR